MAVLLNAAPFTLLAHGEQQVSSVLAGALNAITPLTTLVFAGFAYTRRFFSGRDGSVAALSAVQIGCATAELGVVTPWLAGAPSWPGLPAAGSLLLLGTLGTGYAYILNLRVIRAAGASVAATVTYLTPVWSTALGAVLLEEPVGWHTVGGAGLVVAGILATGSSGSPVRRLVWSVRSRLKRDDRCQPPVAASTETAPTAPAPTARGG